MNGKESVEFKWILYKPLLTALVIQAASVSGITMKYVVLIHN